MKKMNNKGFSLIELIIVIAIMAVLVAIIAPNLTKYLGKSKKETDNTNKNEVIKQVKNCISEAATEDNVNIINPTATQGIYFVDGGDVWYSTNATQGFAELLADVFDDDTKTVSKVNKSNKVIKITISGSESAGFTVDADFAQNGAGLKVS